MKKFMLFLSNRYPRLYGFFLLFFCFAMILAGALFPYVYKSIIYPTAYEKSEASGIITSEVMKERPVHVKSRLVTMYSYYFIINDIDVWIPPSIAREFEPGDRFEYIEYSLNGNVVGECHEYSLFWGIIGLLIDIFVFFWAGAFFLIDTTGKKKEPSTTEVPTLLNYDELTNKELYELCLKQNISIMKGKKNNREYLERCLRTDYKRKVSRNTFRKKEKLKMKRINRILNPIIFIGVVLLILRYMETLHYLIYLIM